MIERHPPLVFFALHNTVAARENHIDTLIRGPELSQTTPRAIEITDITSIYLSVRQCAPEDACVRGPRLFCTEHPSAAVAGPPPPLPSHWLGGLKSKGGVKQQKPEQHHLTAGSVVPVVTTAGASDCGARRDLGRRARNAAPRRAAQLQLPTARHDGRRPRRRALSPACR